MANWAKNVLQVDTVFNMHADINTRPDKKRVKAFFDSLKSQGEFPGVEVDLLIDFQKIIPLEIEEGDLDQRESRWDTWGTICYYFGQSRIDEYTIEFLTKWNGVPDLMLELSRQNPDIKLNYTCKLGYASRTCPVGSFIFKAGDVLMESFSVYGVDFTGCFFDKSVEHVIVPFDVEIIPKFAFIGYENLKSVAICDDVKFIMSSAFFGCENLADIKIPESVEYVGTCAFAGTAWLNNQPDGIVYVGRAAYEYKGEMPNEAIIVISEGTVSITGDAFGTFDGVDNIISLTVEIPDSVTFIADRQFENCSEDFKEKVTIRCSQGSYAHKYATENNIRFELRT